MTRTEHESSECHAQWRSGAALAILFLLLSACSSHPPLHPQTALSSGELTALQAAYDVQHYTLRLTIDPEQQALQGDVAMEAIAQQPITTIELDLDPRFAISTAEVNGSAVAFESSSGKLLLQNVVLSANETFHTRVVYGGNPHIAENAPWEGGFVWSTTDSGEHWIATAVQGRGCDLFWPCKDHISDKPDRGADMHITVPENLTAVMNGVLVAEATENGQSTYHWRTVNPLSTYHLALNIAPYKKYELSYKGKIAGNPQIPVVFYHVSDDMEKVERLISDDFMQQIAFMENTLGPYPWGNEKIGVVETPHLGMEHQTINAYGNGFEVNESGFDWLIFHEIAHEWFGNLLTQENSRDFWLHEGTASFMDSQYYDNQVGAAAYWSQMWNVYNQIANCKPIVPDDHATAMDYFDSNDVYYKGAWSLHTLRWVMGETAFWNTIRRALYGTTDPWNLSYPITPVRRSTEDFIAIASEEHGSDLNWFFDVYHRSTDLPILLSERSEHGIALRWSNYPDFPMQVPLVITEAGQSRELLATADGSIIPAGSSALVRIDPETKVLRDFGFRQWCEE